MASGSIHTISYFAFIMFIIRGTCNMGYQWMDCTLYHHWSIYIFYITLQEEHFVYINNSKGMITVTSYLTQLINNNVNNTYLIPCTSSHQCLNKLTSLTKGTYLSVKCLMVSQECFVLNKSVLPWNAIFHCGHSC